MRNTPAILLASACFILLLPATAQTDSVRIHLTLSREIINGRPTTKNFTIRQKTFDSEMRPVRDIYFDPVTHQISNYIVFFTDDGKVVSEEHFSPDDSLLYAEKYEYNSVGAKISGTRFEKKAGELAVTGKKTIDYTQDTLPVKITEYGPGKKNRSQTTISYNNDHLPVMRYTKYKKQYPNGVRSVSENITYNSKNQKSVIEEIRIMADKSQVTEKDTFNYNAKGLLHEKKVYTNSGELMLKYAYGYYPGGSLSYFSETDNAGKQLKLYSYIYEIRNIDLGSYKSVFSEE